MAERKTIKMINATPNLLFFNLSPYDNPSNVRLIRLGASNTNKAIILPIEVALGVFTDASAYKLYKKGYITFEDNDLLLREAKEANLYFADELDFKPADKQTNELILTQLQKGSRAALEAAIKQYGRDKVLDIAKVNLDSLTTNVKTILEGLLGVSFSINED